MTTSIWLKMVSCGTGLKIIQEEVPPKIPIEMCYLVWQESLEKLTKLVEPQIPDALSKKKAIRYGKPFIKSS